MNVKKVVNLHSRSRRGGRGALPPHFFPKKNFENLKLRN